MFERSIGKKTMHVKQVTNCARALRLTLIVLRFGSVAHLWSYLNFNLHKFHERKANKCENYYMNKKGVFKQVFRGFGYNNR